ncbi:PRC-barrel domain-containing protein [Methylobacterium isbiliense]|uniref:PRC-barrel domain-containing protein n=1 Tax=Methylobacterium isbiliense TaxID=315478 RepID=UPI001EE06C90|nr:PRC-barrel domain-containing protein [Methylobacterium isbiliense]MDN3625007.1 PRC-barrel domain-containing protein [Methylobacterium isbiliense]
MTLRREADVLRTLRTVIAALATLSAVAAAAQDTTAPPVAPPQEAKPPEAAPPAAQPAPTPPPAAQVPPAQAPSGQAPSPPPAGQALPAAQSAQPPAAPPAAQPATPPKAPGTPATVLDTQDYDGVLGKPVRSAAGEDMGRIIDIVVDKEGRPRAAIIDFGGFLGVGSRKIAVDWRALHFSADNKPGRAVLQLTRNQVRVSPEYKPGDPIVVLGPASPAPDPEQAAARNPPDK